MSRIHPKCLDPDQFDHSVAADVLVREEPDEEDEEDDERPDHDDEEDDDEGYSE
jgi:hypothetical protein